MANQESSLPLEQDDDTQKGKFLTFMIGSDVYGIEIKYVTEIIGIQAITEVPELPEHIRGIINLRGKIIPVMDVRLRFKKPFREYNDRTCIIVVDMKDISIGLIVDSVAEVVTIAEEDIVPPPEIKSGNQQGFIKGVGKVGGEVKLLLDGDKLIHHDEAENLSQL
ncbi:purine-binding chemotaxis protein CheW [Paenibacillus oralis]|uniref:Purine-binding chemotaxis protein CheW n=1 Tax=Paenibacillus oralis TaxID=2490856 RepID=A0A3P3UBM2_9BACL|nr:chemotaxis protein CheW [Paenibacillus oralis]RRJ67018.1 purine-binding chemotaxis protein CheW [Paenibacillus oralis]